jgi:hypothetical protein
VSSSEKPERASKPDPDLERPAKPKLLAIEWSAIKLTTDADALALWSKLALTPDDWHDKLEEVPHEYDRPLAIALLRQGNFNCVPVRPTRDCSTPVFDVPEPKAGATLVDPCFRRLVALWAIERLEKDDVQLVIDGLRVIVALPPPESQLIVAALKAVPEDDPAKRLELLVIAFKAGQRDIVNHNLGQLDEPHLTEAITKHHIDGALDRLPASLHRATFLTAIADDKLPTKARVEAITELVTGDDKLGPDLRSALIKVTTTADCTVAAAAARALVKAGDAKFKPTKPRVATTANMMRSLCVLASYEKMSANDEPSLLPAYVPAKGLERIVVSYDALSDVDTDGDGDPHTQHTTDLVAKAELVVPQIDDMIKAMKSCKGTTCTSDDHEFKFGFKPVNGELMFYRLEIVERPPCPRTL